MCSVPVIGCDFYKIFLWEDVHFATILFIMTITLIPLIFLHLHVTSIMESATGRSVQTKINIRDMTWEGQRGGVKKGGVISACGDVC